MLGGEETKHIAIAATCGLAIGAVAGAIGYATLSRSSSPCGTGSCASCSNKLRALPSPVIEHADARGDQTPSTKDAAKMLENLSKRMESLEQAVRSKLLSRSGTNSSIAGYMTAPESPGESDDDEFQDVSGDSR